MPTPPLNPITRHGQLSAGQLRAIAANTEQHDRVSTEGGLTYRRDAAGVRITDERPETILARITSGHNPYGFVQVYDAGDGTFPDWPDGITGDGSTVKAWEVNGNTAVAAGVRVELTLNPQQTGYSFSYCCTT